jgi:flavin reductase (DIM6/NTAB) family NADH-FMN oxidoreductase RutF
MKRKITITPTPGRKHFSYYPVNVAIGGVTLENKTNFMLCAWNTDLSYDPFLYGVSVGIGRATRKFLDLDPPH